MLPPLPHAAAALAGALLDRALGEPKRLHPLVGFGRLADAAERSLRRGAPGERRANRLRGLAAWLLLVTPFAALAWLAGRFTPVAWIADALLLWLALGGRSLAEHAQAVAAPLAAGDAANLEIARERVGFIVSRDTTQLDAEGVAGAAVESVLENGNDAVFGTLFWFFVAGGSGAVLYRLANTLDAMWGYKDARRIHFGWAAARLDDLLNFLPARLTALTYALLGSPGQALACWRTQAAAWSSPNAGPVMAAGAGALGVRLGGPATYHGQIEQRPYLGAGPPQAEVRPPVGGSEPSLRAWGSNDLGAGPPQAEVRPPVGGSEPGLRAWGSNDLGAGAAPTAADIGRALALVRRGQWLWLGVFAAWSILRA